MCGIVGYVGAQPGLEVVLDGLRRLEYLGYDSAGVAVLSDDGELHVDTSGDFVFDLATGEGEELTGDEPTGDRPPVRDGGLVIRDAQDALDEVLGVGVATALTGQRPEDLAPPLRRLLRRVEDGRDTVAALAVTPAEARDALAGLAELEILGFLRRGPGGRYARLL